MTSPARQSNHLCESRGEYRSNSLTETLFLSRASTRSDFYDLASSSDPLAMCRRCGLAKNGKWLNKSKAIGYEILRNRTNLIS